MDAVVKRQRDLFLLLAFLTAVFLQVSDGWVREGGQEPGWLASLRGGSFIAAIFCAVASLYFLWKFRSTRNEHDQIDSRCIMEGLRVQFYWSVAGTGVSAASNYLLRQRGSIRWIINAISSASLPYEKCRAAFQSLHLTTRYLVLKWAIHGWISAKGKKAQIGYYKDAIQKIQTEQPLFKFQGWVCLVASVLLAVYAAGVSHLGVVRPHFSGLTAGGVLILGVLVLVCIVHSLLASHSSSVLERPAIWLTKKASCPNPNSGWARESLPLWPRMRTRPEATQNRLRLVRWVAFVTFYAVILTATLIGLASCLAPMADWLPSPGKMLGMMKNILAALAARAFLASNLRFYTENLRNYQAMHALFTKGNERLQQLLKLLRQQVLPKAPKLPDPAGAEQTIHAIQAQMVALGKEALSEHAEWLHLHRDRPVTTNLPTG